ncbi:carbamoyltransferase HypF [Aminiphilus circumscriptus]|uniref:carbamoyltransferase HypF n=1 Tax=Aminiphilus circumscriptus TaxID=290732 RepID=UPI0004923C6E|nr:carbamoyltransferase HypF [Aminiphilus circumscriptus]
MNIRVSCLVIGTVQGVGFRPFCVRLAARHGVGGDIRNTSRGVEVLLEGESTAVDAFLRDLTASPPPLAMINDISVQERTLLSSSPRSAFSILPSLSQEEQQVFIPPDVATCAECLAEIKNPRERRFRYPFTNCTNCGPRFTIITSLPYDRPGTTMASFPLCPSCAKEYEDVNDRRYHAQPVACPACGPRLRFLSRDGEELALENEALLRASCALREGHIVAIKGLGGFHLAVRPEDHEAILRLRQRKVRPHKPFALMVKDTTVAKRLVRLSAKAEALLVSPAAPILLCFIKEKGILSPLVAPYRNTLGIMLPYTPLHHLLMEDFDALIMTSANLSDEPLVADTPEALIRLRDLADFFLEHDRPIRRRIDDSVVACSSEFPVVIRRARGYVPTPFVADAPLPELLAAGAEMKATFAVTQGNSIFLSQYLGDLKELETMDLYKDALLHFLELFKLTPRFLVKDLHPQFVSSRLVEEALASSFEATLTVQHHHAHLAACLFENRVEESSLGVILDGVGYGTDGTLWGGELLYGNARFFRRVGALESFPLLGGDRAVQEPWRIGYALLAGAVGENEAKVLGSELWPERASVFDVLDRLAFDAPRTTSCGRLFDGVAALLGLRSEVSYDAQAAMELEDIAEVECDVRAPFSVVAKEDVLRIDWRPTVRWLLENRGTMGSGALSQAFHAGLAAVFSEVCVHLGRSLETEKVALSGGVWQNMRLLEETRARLERAGLVPLLHRQIPPNDECVALGQAMIGAAHWKAACSERKFK